MPKLLVFISHITAESEIAVEFKALIEQHFLGLIDVFVSSDGTSIQMGQKWLNDISDALEKCAVEIVICSPVSVQRPWINFEAGAGWVRKIPVIPLCHSGMEPSQLPVPLNLLRAAKATDVSALNRIFPVLANALGAQTPNVDFTEFIRKVIDFERRYTFWTTCNAAFDALEQVAKGTTAALKGSSPVVVNLTDIQINFLTPHMNFLQSENVLSFARVGNSEVTTTGTYYDCRLAQLAELSKVVSDPYFTY